MIIILADIHANLDALVSVLNDANSRWGLEIDLKAKQADKMRSMESWSNHTIVSLGDMVGYGEKPHEVMDILWPICDIKIAGNHEYYVANKDGAKNLSDRAEESVAKTAEQFELSEGLLPEEIARRKRNLTRIRQLFSEQEKFIRKEGSLIYAHANPLKDGSMQYVKTIVDANRLFFDHERFDGSICFVGHLHQPYFYVSHQGEPTAHGQSALPKGTFGETYDVSGCKKALFVVPSVGDPRDGDKRPGYAAYNKDNGKVQFIRVS